MIGHSVNITDTVADISPVLRRMRLDGLDRVTVPFAERHVLAWLGGPELHNDMDPETLVNVVKV